MRRVLPEIRARGAEVWAIGNGNVEQLNWFIDDQKPEHVVWTDPSRATYRAAGFKRGSMEVYGPRALANIAKFLARGYKNRGAIPKGDGLQQGGVLIVAPDDRILFHHVDQRWGDHASTDDILAALK